MTLGRRLRYLTLSFRGENDAISMEAADMAWIFAPRTVSREPLQIAFPAQEITFGGQTPCPEGRGVEPRFGFVPQITFFIVERALQGMGPIEYANYVFLSRAAKPPPLDADYRSA